MVVMGEIVVPESVDAIRALMGPVKDGATSIARTDEALGIRREFLVAPVAPEAKTVRAGMTGCDA